MSSLYLVVYFCLNSIENYLFNFSLHNSIFNFKFRTTHVILFMRHISLKQRLKWCEENNKMLLTRAEIKFFKNLRKINIPYFVAPVLI